MRYKGHTLPSLAELASIIRSEALAMYPDDEVDVRLVVAWKDSRRDGEWNVNVGCADYDQWHGHCGAASIASADRTHKASRAIARDLLEQVKDAISLSSEAR